MDAVRICFYYAVVLLNSRFTFFRCTDYHGKWTGIFSTRLQFGNRQHCHYSRDITWVNSHVQGFSKQMTVFRVENSRDRLMRPARKGSSTQPAESFVFSSSFISFWLAIQQGWRPMSEFPFRLLALNVSRKTLKWSCISRGGLIHTKVLGGSWIPRAVHSPDRPLVVTLGEMTKPWL